MYSSEGLAKNLMLVSKRATITMHGLNPIVCFSHKWQQVLYELMHGKW